MPDSTQSTHEIGPGRDPVEVLAEEFAQRLRNGEHPAIEAYARRYPELAESIRALFPSVAMMERAGAEDPAASGPPTPLTDGFELTQDTVGDFRIIGEIGRGGMGVVYEAEQHSLNRRVALKILCPAVSRSPRQVARFRREAEAAARLHHTNIVPVFGTGEADGLHFYAMQLIDGVSFGDIIDAMREPTGDEKLPAPTRGAGGDSSDASSIAFTVPGAAARMLRRTARSRKHARSGQTESATDDYLLTRGAAEPSPPEGDARAERDARGERDARAEGDARGEGEPPDPPPSPPAQPSVADLLADRPEYWRRVAKVGMSVARALSYSHQQGILHRDIKPSNVLLDRDGIVWVTDFGLAKHANHAGVTRPGDIVGTIRYMAPEQFNGQADARSDIHSLGLMLYELLTLQPAFADERHGPLIRQKMSSVPPPPPRTIVPHVPRDLETIVLKASAVSPAHRYARAEALEADLKRFLEDRPISARRIYPPEQLWRWTRRNPLVAALSGATALLLFATVLIFAIGKYDAEKARDLLEKQSRHTESTVVLLEQEQKEGLRARALLEQEKKDAVKARDLAAREKGRAEDARDLLALEKARVEKQREAAVQATRRAMRESAGREKNLKVALEAFEQIVKNISSRGVPRSLELVIAQEPSVVTPADVQLLETLLRFFDRFADDNRTSLQTESAAARKRVGDIQQQLGRLDKAAASYRKAFDGYARLAEQNGDSASLVAQRARTLNAIGIAKSRGGNIVHAREHHRLARTILAGSPWAHAPAVRFELAKTLILSASVGEQARVTADAASAPPASPMRPTGGSGADPGRRDGPASRPTRGAAEPGRECQLALTILTELVRKDGKNRHYRFVLVRGHRTYIRILLGRGDIKSAYASLHSAISHLEKLTRGFPKIPAFEYELADTLRTHIPTDDTYTTRVLRAVELSEQLVTAHPDIPEYRSLAGNCLSQLAAIEFEAGKLKEASGSYQRAIAYQRPTAERFASAPLIQRAYARSLAGLAAVRLRTRDQAVATALLDEAISRLQAFKQDTPMNRAAIQLLTELRRQRAKLPHPSPTPRG